MTQDQTKANRSWKRPFFTIAAGQTVSLIGSSAVQFSLIWWLASETASPVMMALAGLAAFLPQLVLGPFAGVWIDRLPRKYVAVGADLFAGLVAVAFAAAFRAGSPPYWSACLALGVRAVGGVFHTPAIQAIVPLLVPQEELVRANGLSQFMQSGAFMLGPVFGALLYGALPMPLILLTDLLGALAACGALLAVRVPEAPRTGARTPDFRREWAEGARVFCSDRRLLLTLAAAALCMVFYMPLSSLYPLMTSSYFAASAFHAGAVEFLYAAGMMGASLLMGLFGRVKDKLFLAGLGLLGIGATSLVCGVLPPRMGAFWVFAFACMLMGASGTLYGVPIVAYMQAAIPHEAQGRAFSLMSSVMSVTMPLGLLISGPVAERFGVAAWFFITGAATLLIAGAALVLVRAKRGP